MREVEVQKSLQMFLHVGELCWTMIKGEVEPEEEENEDWREKGRAKAW